MARRVLHDRRLAARRAGALRAPPPASSRSAAAALRPCVRAPWFPSRSAPQRAFRPHSPEAVALGAACLCAVVCFAVVCVFAAAGAGGTPDELADGEEEPPPSEVSTITSAATTGYHRCRRSGRFVPRSDDASGGSRGVQARCRRGASPLRSPSEHELRRRPRRKADDRLCSAAARGAQGAGAGSVRPRRPARRRPQARSSPRPPPPPRWRAPVHARLRGRLPESGASPAVQALLRAASLARMAARASRRLAAREGLGPLVLAGCGVAAFARTARPATVPAASAAAALPGCDAGTAAGPGACPGADGCGGSGARGGFGPGADCGAGVGCAEPGWGCAATAGWALAGRAPGGGSGTVPGAGVPEGCAAPGAGCAGVAGCPGAGWPGAGGVAPGCGARATGRTDCTGCACARAAAAATTRCSCSAARSGARPAHSRRRLISRAWEKTSSERIAMPTIAANAAIAPTWVNVLERRARAAS